MVENTKIVDMIVNHYDIFDNRRDLRVEPLKYYPHIQIIKSSEKSYYLKMKTGISNAYDRLYEALSKCVMIHMPQKTTKGHYAFEDEGKCYFLYEKLRQCSAMPVPHWWGTLLNCIHGCEIEYEGLINNELLDIDFSLSLFRKAETLMNCDIKRAMFKLIDKVNLPSNLLSAPRVLSHTDLGPENTMLDSSRFKIIDSEGSCLLPAEYDLQHLIWAFSTEINHFNDWVKFSRDVCMQYINSGRQIDKIMLDYLYRVDFIKSVSWLYLISECDCRKDRPRQLMELHKFNRTIASQYHDSILEILLRE